MDQILELQAMLLRHLTVAEALIVGLIVDGLLIIFAIQLLILLAKARLRIARLLRLISKEKYNLLLEDRRRTISKKRTAAKAKRQRWMLVVYFAFIALVIVTMGFNFHWQSSQPLKTWERGTIGPLGERISRIATRFLKEKDIRDMCIGVVAGDDVFSTCLSQAPSSDTFILDDTAIFEIGSITKTFTYAAMWEILGEHDIAIESPIRPFLPETMLARNRSLGAITWKQLATHTSGLANLPYSIKEKDLLRGTFGAILAEHLLNNPYEYLGKDHVQEYLSSAIIEDRSPRQINYSNLAVGLLGTLLSELEGESYELLISRLILSPLHMTSTTAGAAMREDRAMNGYAQYRRLGAVVMTARAEPWLFPDAMAGAGGISSTLADMTAYLRSRMEEYRKARFRNGRHAVSLGNGDAVTVNLGWFLAPLPREYEGEQIVFHDGRTGGFQSFLGFSDSREVGVVILSNGTRDVSELGAGLVRLLINDLREMEPIAESQ